MKTPYNEIVNIASIGSQTNPISLNEILRKANDEQLTPAAQNKERVLFLGIDVQQDFMDNGALGVPGAHGDVERMTQFIYNNMDKITNIAVSIDTHTPHQIFHPCWWIDENGNNPAPYTPITLADLDSGKYRAVIYPRQSRDYVEHLEKDGKKTLCVWSYHCLQGTSGAAFENQFANMIYFHSVAKKAVEYLNVEEIVTAFISFGGQATQEAKDLGFKNILDVSSSASELRRAFNCLSKSVIENSKSAVSKQDDFFDV